MNPLSPGTLVPIIVSSIPPSAEPSLKSPYDSIALLCHACFLSVDFRLIGLGEDHRIDASSEADRPQPLPAEWNESRTSDYSFRYKHPQSSMEYLLKISRLGGKSVITGMGLGDDRVRSFDVKVADYVSESSFPVNQKTGGDEVQAQRAILDIFISEARLADFANLFKLGIIQPLLPGLQKQGYEESSSSTTQTSTDPTHREQERREREDSQRRPPQDPLPPLAQPRPVHDPLMEPPRRPFPAGDFPPPGFEDEHEILAPRNRGGFGAPRMPLSGEQDLYPPGMGPNDPLRIGPGGRPRGGGMYPAADDPMFGGLEGFYNDRAPPGARYDPVGPHDGPPNLRGGPNFPRQGGSGGFGGPPNPFSGFGRDDFI